jgi:hypothetical protein
MLYRVLQQLHHLRPQSIVSLSLTQRERLVDERFQPIETHTRRCAQGFDGLDRPRPRAINSLATSSALDPSSRRPRAYSSALGSLIRSASHETTRPSGGRWHSSGFPPCQDSQMSQRLGTTFGCDYCHDDHNRLYGHVTQIASNEALRLILLECPRCGALYENAPKGDDATRRLTYEEAQDRFGYVKPT